MTATHSLTCDSPEGHPGRCQPRIHRCTAACAITWQIEDEDGEFLGEVATQAALDRVAARAAAQGMTIQVHEVCNAD